MRKTPIAQAIEAACPRIPGQSSVIDMIKAFWPLDRLVADLYAGEIGYVGPVAVMLDHDGTYGEISPSLQGWCSTFERMAGRLRIDIDLGLMRRISRRLDIGMMLDTTDIHRFVALVERCRAIYFACPVWIRHQCYLDECIAIAVDDLGLREAA